MILPADSYVVVNKTLITEVDRKILVDLYQPIIGNKAVALYFTLLNDIDRKSIITKEFSHHHLLSVMQLSLEEIVVAREKLEGIGLLDTYVRKDLANSYVYVLYNPVSASEFFNHPILNVVLYNNVGKIEYDNIVALYKRPRLNFKDYEKISLNFDEVFSSVPKGNFVGTADLIAADKNEILFKNAIDFDLLMSGFDEGYFNKKTFTKEVKNLINSLSFLYDIDIVTMQRLIKANLNEKGLIDKDGLRKSARNFYQFENGGNLPTLIHYMQPSHLKSPAGDLSSKGKMIYTFENTNPYQFLKSKYKDGKIVTRDIRIIENLLIDLKLTPAVVNVLLDYVLRVNNKKLNKTYIETIASHWKRLGIETAEEAMNACIKEHKKKKNKDKDVKSKQEKLPDWFDQNIENKKLEDKEEEELLNLIKNYK